MLTDSGGYMTNSINEIKGYWNNRAKEHTSDRQGTTNDVYLRELEINTIADKIRELDLCAGAALIDIGCGDGYSTMRLAKEFPEYDFTGVDYSKSMIDNALNHRDEDAELKRNVQFKVADVLNLNDALGDAMFDVAISMRVLINLPELSQQEAAIRNVASKCAPNGRYIAVENFMDGQRNLNELRASVGLPDISVRWHNRFFEKEEFENAAKNSFKSMSFIDFASSYYYVTRVVYSKMCQIQGIEPSYDHDLYNVAVELPYHGEFSPIRMIVLGK